MKNFLGINDFVWFFGVVEDRNDPVQLGRVRVRCYGWHTDDKNEILLTVFPGQYYPRCHFSGRQWKR